MPALLLPASSTPLLQAALPRIDYFDAFEMSLVAKPGLTIDTLFLDFMSPAPRWVTWLMRLRHALVRRLGLKIESSMDWDSMKNQPIEAERSYGMFKIFARSENEIVAGADDKHLNFRASFLLKPGSAEETQVLTVATVVQMHNALGRTYMAVIKPFHRLIVPAMMRHALRSYRA